MKVNNALIPKDDSAKRGFSKQKAILAFLLLGAFLTNLSGAPLVLPQFGSMVLTAMSQTALQDDPLDSEAAAAFVEALGEEAKNVLNDFLDMDGVTTTFDQITEKITERGDMAGKTKKEIVALYLADVKSVVENADTIKAMETAFAKMLKPTVATDPPAEEPTEPPVKTPATTPKTTPDIPTRPGTNAELRQYIRGLKYNARELLAVQGDGGVMVPIEKPKPQPGDGIQRKQGNSKIIRCLRNTRSLSSNFEDVAILQPTEGVIYPGALVYADQELVDGKPRPLTGLPRAPIDLRLDLPGLQEEGSFTIVNPTNGKVQSSLNKALNFWNNSTSFKDGYTNPSRSSSKSTMAYSSEQIALSLGFNAKWASGDASASFKFDKNSEKNVVVAVYRQVFYTVTFDAPNLPEQFFDASVTVAEAKEAFETEKPSAPGYVSSVNYGRILMFRMETDKNTLAIDAEAAFKYAAGAITVGGTAEAKYKQILSNAQISVVTMGGGAEAMSESISARKASDLEAVIKGKNAVYSKNNPGVPITYTVKFLKDNVIAKMGATTDFTTEECKELDNLWVKVIHSGAYIGHFIASWDEPDPNNPAVMVRKERKEEGKTAGYQFKFDFPGDAANIRLKMENDTGLVWQPRREIMNRVLQPVDYNTCYTVHGTTLGSGFTAAKSLGSECP